MGRRIMARVASGVVFKFIMHCFLAQHFFFSFFRLILLRLICALLLLYLAFAKYAVNRVARRW
jgi:hypothetical protein